ncbi:hypothetical protein G7046_g2368 [Stylonectria norvegica]|nr:hypothetical protein G7046_g2368 [Stylonectria norvegica]
MVETKTPRNAVSLLRLSFEPTAQDKIDTSPQWYKAMENITKEPGFRYVARGEALDDACDLVLMVGWTHGTQPSTAFRTGAESTPTSTLNTILAPILPFLSQQPQLRTIYHEYAHANANMLTTSPRGRLHTAMMEQMTVRGPVGVVEPVLKTIEETLRNFHLHRDQVRSEDQIMDDAWDGVYLFSVDENKSDREGGNGDDQATFALFLRWSSREGRMEFQDPTIVDRALSPGLQTFYSSDFWQEKVAKPLQKLVEQGATISSWDFHKAKIVPDKRGSQLVASPADIWG